MGWTLTHELDSYLAAAGVFLRSRPVQHTVHLSVAETLRVRGNSAFGDLGPLFGWWSPAGSEVTAALLHTPPHPLLLTALPDGSLQPLAEALESRGSHPSGVNASAADATAFAAAWTRLTGATAQEFRHDRLYRLDRLELPEPMPPGTARVATAADRDLLESWFSAFGAEVGEMPGRSSAVDDRLSHGGLTLWEDDGAPVSLAGRGRRSAGTVRVGPVYTPPERRRRGYAGAVTAAVSQAALDDGADSVVLFTDLANPTSNSVYQRLGYRPVEDRLILTFSG
jgi:predicted GNAT family acetyltransferase